MQLVIPIGIQYTSTITTSMYVSSRVSVCGKPNNDVQKMEVGQNEANNSDPHNYRMKSLSNFEINPQQSLLKKLAFTEDVDVKVLSAQRGNSHTSTNTIAMIKYTRSK